MPAPIPEPIPVTPKKWQRLKVFPHYPTSSLKVGDSLYAGTYVDGMFKSTDNGRTWTAISDGLPKFASITSLTYLNGFVYAGTYYSGVFKLKDGESAWVTANTGLPTETNDPSRILRITALASDESTATPIVHTLYAGTIKGLYKSTDGGEHWTKEIFSIAGPELYVSKLLVKNQDVYVAPSKKGLFKYGGTSQSWSQVTSLAIPITSDIKNLLVANDVIYATYDRKLAKSTDNGASWDLVVTTGLPINATAIITSLLSFTDVGRANLYAGTAAAGVYRSTNGGSNWSEVNIGLPSVNFLANLVNIGALHVTCMSILPPGFYVSRFVPTSIRWVPTEDQAINSFLAINNSIFAGSSNGLLKSTDGGQTWKSNSFEIEGLSGSGSNTQTVIQSLSTSSLATIGENIYAGIFNPLSWLSGSRVVPVLKSTNGGVAWAVPAASSLGNYKVAIYAMSTMNNELYFGGFSEAGTSPPISKISDNNSTYTPMDEGLPSGVQILSLLTFNGDIYAGYIGGISRLIGGNLPWTPVNTGLPGGVYVYSLLATDNVIFAGALGRGVYKSVDSGATWVATNQGFPTNTSGTALAVGIHNLFAAGSNIYAGTTKGVFKSSDSGANWGAVSEDERLSIDVSALLVTDDAIFAGTPLGIWVYR